MGGPQENMFEEAKARYVIPGGSVERDRLRVQHEWIKGTAGGLIKAPIDLTAKQMKDGALTARDATSNCVAGATERHGVATASVGELFDLINQRLLFAFFQRLEINQIVKRLVGCLKPGGWIQFFEYDHYTMVADPQATTYLLFYKLAERKVRNLNVKVDILTRWKTLDARTSSASVSRWSLGMHMLIESKA
ncbi:hypothetical protein FQN49_008510 [Arthroderma sp. PD_2]|nr:hypothetical protein FQN49_008510 [Arthroderma sp. PD_2]